MSKISELPIGQPLGGREFLPMVQDGGTATGRVDDIADLTGARLNGLWGSVVNLFDPTMVIEEREWLPDQAIPTEHPESAVSAPMFIKGAKAVVVAGLSPNPVVGNRFGRFLAGDAATPVGPIVVIPTTHNFWCGVPPVGAVWFQFTLRQRQSPWPYGFGGVRVYASNAPWAGKRNALGGDSITQTNNVAAGRHVYGDGTRPNWPDHVMRILCPRSVMTYAEAGARFSDVDDGVADRRFLVQVSKIIAAHAVEPFDLITLAFGTNDFGGDPAYVTLGSAAAAIAKDFDDLDPLLSCDAMVKGVQMLRNACPTAQILGMTPIQRGDINPNAPRAPAAVVPDMTTMWQWNEEIKAIYRHFAIPHIDQMGEVGIVHRLETDLARANRHLEDRLHPFESGSKMQAAIAAPRMRMLLEGL